MYVSINKAISLPMDEVKMAIENADPGSSYIDIDISERFYVDADDLMDVDSMDVIELYNELGFKDQGRVIKDLEEILSVDVDKEGFIPSNLDEEMKLEYLLSKISTYSLEELKKRLEP